MPLRLLPTAADHLARASLRLQGYHSRRVPTSAGRVHVMTAAGGGSSPQLVLLHGFSSAGVHYLPLLRRFRPHVRRLVIPDLPGHGFSDLPTAGMSEATLRTGLFEALDRVLDAPAVLFGNSMGGFAALRYAQARPDRVRGLVLVSPGGAPMTPAELDAFRLGFQLRTYNEALAFVDRLLHRPATLRPVIAWGVRQKFKRSAMRQLMATLRHEDLLVPTDLSALGVPILFVWGRSERILPASGLAFFQAHLPPHATVLQPEGFGHSPYLERPDELSQMTLDFLRELPIDVPAPIRRTA